MTSVFPSERISPIDFLMHEFVSPRPSVWTKSRGAEYQNPPSNVINDEDHFEIQMMVPGFRKEDFTIQVKDRQLIVSSLLPKGEGEVSLKYSLHEFDVRPIKRIFQLNTDKVDAEGISAKYESGVLSIRLPKKNQTEDNAKTILIQ